MCDIYGKGWKNELGISYKGELGAYHNQTIVNNKTKYDALIDYKYTICIENCSKKNYFTEKITDAFLCWTIPIYFGCPNISDYFPIDSFYIINPNDNNCLENIINIINKPITDKQLNALEESRNLVLNKYNIWNTIENILISDNNLN